MTSSDDYLSFTVTPDIETALTTAQLTFDFYRDGANSIRHFAIYADDDAGMNPGSNGGDNFQTKIGGGSITSTGSWTTASVPLGGVPFLQQVESPIAFRIYFWGETGVGSVARVDNVRVSQVDVAAQPEVESVVVNNGDSQRSSLTSLTVTFDTLVDAPASAFSITNLGVPSGSSSTILDSLVVMTEPVAGKTVATITFDPGTSVIHRNTINTLADGNYRLDVIASLITLAGGGQPMAQNYRFGANAADDFFRLFGDENGDGTVNIFDFSNGFLPAFGSSDGASNYRDEWDANGDGIVNIFDFANGFLPNFGMIR